MTYKLSIITINLNNAEGLRETMESVVAQTFKDFEYIIIDGASKDKSLVVIESLANIPSGVYSSKEKEPGQLRRNPITYWLSEPDSGIYNAMNKGIAKATGEYCLFLNSGDRLSERITLENVFISNTNGIDIISGYVDINSGGGVRIYPPRSLLFSALYTQNIPHQAEFIRRTLFYEIGFYNENYQILSDYEFNIKAIMHNASYKYIDLKIAIVENDGVSSKFENINIIDRERILIFESTLPKGIWQDYLVCLDKRKNVHPSIDWAISNKPIFKILKLMYRFCSSSK